MDGVLLSKMGGSAGSKRLPGACRLLPGGSKETTERGPEEIAEVNEVCPVVVANTTGGSRLSLPLLAVVCENLNEGRRDCLRRTVFVRIGSDGPSTLRCKGVDKGWNVAMQILEGSRAWPSLCWT